jgi:hypothetical protein
MIYSPPNARGSQGITFPLSHLNFAKIANQASRPLLVPLLDHSNRLVSKTSGSLQARLFFAFSPQLIRVGGAK